MLSGAQRIIQASVHKWILFVVDYLFLAQMHRNESVWPHEHAAVTDGTPANPSSSAPWTAKPGRGHEPGQCASLHPGYSAHGFAAAVLSLQ